MLDYYSPASASDGNRNSRQGSDICRDWATRHPDYFLDYARRAKTALLFCTPFCIKTGKKYETLKWNPLRREKRRQ